MSKIHNKKKSWSQEIHKFYSLFMYKSSLNENDIEIMEMLLRMHVKENLFFTRILT